MRATAIVRRIDNLGRVVIPKEICRTMKIREGDPFEIFLDNDCVCFRKYSMLGNIEDCAKNASDSLIACGIDAAIFDNFGNLVSGVKSFEICKEELIENLDKRSVWKLSKVNGVACLPVLSDGEIVGYILFEHEHDTNTDIVRPIAKMLALTLSR